MPDGREVSKFWGGSKNPDGSVKKRKMPVEQAAGKKKVARTKRAATKAAVRQRFLGYRATQEKPKLFEAWLLHVASERLAWRVQTVQMQRQYHRCSQNSCVY